MTLSILAERMAAVMEGTLTSITAVSMKSHILLEYYLLKHYFGI
jgi:hypothetical protein